MNVLFLSRWFPYPVNNGSKLRITGLLRGLAKHHAVTLVSFSDQPDARPDALELQSICSAIHIVPWREVYRDSWRARLRFFSLQPRFLIDSYSNEMADLLRRLIADNAFDLIIASQLPMASYRSSFPRTPAIFEELELGQLYSGIASTSGYWERLRFCLTRFRLGLHLTRLLEAFQVYTVASEQERQLFVKHFPAHEKKLAIIPNCIQYDDYQGLAVERMDNRLVFAGSLRYYANYEAMRWFVCLAFPRILEQLPEVQLLITGEQADLPLPFMQNVTLSGCVADIKTVIAASTISLAPIFNGGGTRLKILEAMALGTPVVATSKGAEGLGAIAGEHLLIADLPEDYADQVIRLLSNPDLCAHISRCGKRFVKERYDWEPTISRFLELAEGVIE
jgi:polysaccharide biosynthesis protein PslH